MLPLVDNYRHLSGQRRDMKLSAQGREKLCRYRTSLSLCCLTLLLLLLPPPLLAAPPGDEYKLKTALIYKISKFIEWPGVAGVDKPQSFGVCLLGEDNFRSALDALEEKTIQGLPIQIYRFSQSDSVTSDCQVLFISESKQAFLQSIIDKLRSKPILTLGDTSKFAEQGGMIQFTYGSQRIGFNINLGRTKEAGLEIAAPLLQLAKIIESPS